MPITPTTTLSDIATADDLTYYDPNASGAPQMGDQWTPINMADADPALVAAGAAVGFSGEAWVNESTGEVIIASRGMVPSNTQTDLSAYQLGTDQVNDAQSVANQFAEAAIDQANSMLADTGVTLGTIYLTGHSLGGSEAMGEAVDLTDNNNVFLMAIPTALSPLTHRAWGELILHLRT